MMLGIDPYWSEEISNGLMSPKPTGTVQLDGERVPTKLINNNTINISLIKNWQPKVAESTSARKDPSNTKKSSLK